MTEICDSLRQPTLVKTEWICSASYQKLFDKSKLIIKEDACVTFYNEMELLYLEINASRVEFRANLLQTREGMSCPRDEASDNNILRPIIFPVRACQPQKEIQ